MQTHTTGRPTDRPHIGQILRGRLGRFRGVGHFLLAFLLSDAAWMGTIRPFGLCYALALPKADRLWGCAGTFLGSLMINGTRGGLVYGAVGIVTLAADTFLLQESRMRELLLPLLLAGIIAIVKLPFALIEGMGSIGLLALECLLAALCCYTRLLPEEGQSSRVRQAVLHIMVITAFAGLRIFGVLSPAGAAAILLTMTETYAAARERENDLRGGVFGLLIGAALDMANGGGPFFAAVFGLSASLASLLPERGRIAFCLRFLLGGISCLLWSFADGRAMGCIYDLFLAASVFLLLPESGMVLPQGGLHTVHPRPSAAEALRLQQLSRALTALTRSIGAPAEGEEDISVIFDHAASSVCRSCSLAKTCWIDDYVSTIDACNGLLPQLRRRGHIGPKDPEGILAIRCSRKSELCSAINREYMSYLRRRAERNTRQEQARQLQEQYAGIGAAVDGLVGAARSDYVHKPVAEKQIRTILSAYRRRMDAEVYRKNGRLHIRIGPFEPDEPWVDEEAFVRSAELAMDCRLLPAETVCVREGEARLYKEGEALRVILSAAVRKKQGEEVCGDSYLFLHTEDGRAVVLLSDGMGTGRDAARLSRNAVELIAAFVRSGCSMEESAAAVIPFLRARGAEGFATLDLLEIDLFSGGVRWIKCGAADGFVVEQGQVRRLSADTLPPGADPGSHEPPRAFDLTVRAGSRILLASDGAELDDLDLLCRPELTAGEVIRACGREAADDLTVLILSVTEADNPAGSGQDKSTNHGQ